MTERKDLIPRCVCCLSVIVIPFQAIPAHQHHLQLNWNMKPTSTRLPFCCRDVDLSKTIDPQDTCFVRCCLHLNTYSSGAVCLVRAMKVSALHFQHSILLFPYASDDRRLSSVSCQVLLPLIASHPPMSCTSTVDCQSSSHSNVPVMCSIQLRTRQLSSAEIVVRMPVCLSVVCEPPSDFTIL